MNCHEAARLIDAYVDDELAAAEAALVADHIEGCPMCRQRVAEREWLKPLVRSMPYHAAPARLRAAVAAARPQPRRSWHGLAWAAGLAIAVTAAGAVGVRARYTAQATTALAADVLDRHIAALASERPFERRAPATWKRIYALIYATPTLPDAN